MGFRVFSFFIALILCEAANAANKLEAPPRNAVEEEIILTTDNPEDNAAAKDEAEAVTSDAGLIKNLQEAIDVAQETNPEIEQAKTYLKAVKENENQAIGGFLPDISADVQYGKQKNSIGGANATDSDINAQSINLRQPVWSGERNSSRYDKAILQIESAEFALKETQNRVKLETIRAYINVVTDKKLYDLAVDSQKILEQNYSMNKDRFDYGVLSNTDISQSKTRNALAKVNRINASNNLASSKAAFKKITGGEFQIALLNNDVALPEIPKSLEESVNLAHKNNPAIRQFGVGVKLAEEDVDASYAELLPELNLEASALRNSNYGLIEDKYRNDSLMLRLSIPLFKGGAEYSRISQSKKMVSSKEYELLDKKNALAQQVSAVWEQIKTSVESLEASEEAVAASLSALDGAKDEEQMGLRTVIEVLDAEQERINAQSSHIKSKRDQLVNYYTLLNLIGE